MEVTLERRLAVQQKVYSVDVRNHHRIWDAQKHLQLTLDGLKEKFIDKFFINVRIQQNILNRLKHLFNRDKSLAEVCSPTKGLFTRCENSSQNPGCSKTST